MARDVIHETCELKLERVDIVDASNSTKNGTVTGASMKPFPLVANPPRSPDFSLDPLSLKFTCRNTMSNACECGERGGIVAEFTWNKSEEQLLPFAILGLTGVCQKLPSNQAVQWKNLCHCG